MVRAEHQTLLNTGPCDCVGHMPTKLTLMETKERCCLMSWKLVIGGFGPTDEVFSEEVNLARTCSEGLMERTGEDGKSTFQIEGTRAKVLWHEGAWRIEKKESWGVYSTESKESCRVRLEIRAR